MKKFNIIEKVNVILLIIVFVFIVVFFIIGFFTNKRDDKEIEIEKTTSRFNYNLYENKSELYKEEFDNLISLLDNETIDYENYARIISKLFIIDFYTLNNKKSSYDIGGVQYIHKELKDNFVLNASNTVYKYLSISSNELPIVKEVSVTNVESTEYDYNKTNYNGYIVSLSWGYEKELDYEKTSSLVLIKDGEQLFIVEKKEL